MSDALASERKLRMLTVVDTCTRESLAIEVDTSLSGARVARMFDHVISDATRCRRRSHGRRDRTDGEALDQSAYDRGVRLRFIDPGRPGPGCAVESFDGRLRDECFNEHSFTSLYDARGEDRGLESGDNRERPRSWLGNRTAEEFRARVARHARAVVAGRSS